jgi:DNA-binding YbaB/EbfC family protein
MANMMKMLKQAASMQKNMEKMQGELAERSVEFSAGGGMVTVVAKGDISVESIKIDPRAVDPDDVEMLEDLVLAGVDGALKSAQEMVTEEMGKLTKGMNIPGLGM